MQAEIISQEDIYLAEKYRRCLAAKGQCTCLHIASHIGSHVNDNVMALLEAKDADYEIVKELPDESAVH